MRNETSSGRTPSKYRPYAWLLGFVVTLVFLLLVFASKRRVVPEELIGDWTTTDAAYQDRFLTIYSGTVSFGTGDGTVSTGFIQKVEQTSSRTGEVIYSLFYKGDDGEQQISLALEPATGLLRLKNQPKIVWKKSGT